MGGFYPRGIFRGILSPGGFIRLAGFCGGILSAGGFILRGIFSSGDFFLDPYLLHLSSKRLKKFKLTYHLKSVGNVHTNCYIEHFFFIIQVDLLFGTYLQRSLNISISHSNGSSSHFISVHIGS